MKLGRSLGRLLLLLTILIGTGLRLYRLQDLPPGIFIDEAYYAWDGLRVLQTGYLAAFFPANNGREPLFIYLQGAAMAVFGVYPWVLHIIPVLAGIATIPVVYLLGRTLFSSERRAQVIGLAAAAALAVLYWHISFSRLRFRAILLPLTSALAVYFFARGWRSGRRRDFVFGGIWLGLTLYTYISARLLPFILLAFVLALVALDLWSNRHSAAGRMSLLARRVVTGCALMFVTAFLVALPLLYYFYLHPGDFIGRTDQAALTPQNMVAAHAAPEGVTSGQLLAANVIKVGRMFIDHGDDNPRHNLPGLPALDPLMALGFFVALVAGLLYFRRQPVYLLLFGWLAAMLMPSVLSMEAPHFLRTIGAIPPLVVLVGDGLTRIWNRLVPRLSPAFLVSGILLVSGALTYHNYFQVWANDPLVYNRAFDVVAAPVSAEIKELSGEADVLVPLRLYGSPTLHLLLSGDYPQQESYASEDEPDRPLVIVSSGGTGDSEWVLLTHNAQGQGEALFPDVMPDLAASFRQGPSSQPFFGPRGVRMGSAIPMKDAARTALQPAHPASTVDVNFGNEIRLIGYTQGTGQAAPGQTVQLTLYWRSLVNFDRDYLVFVHLLDPTGAVRAQVDSEPVNNWFSTALWPRGVVIPDVYSLTLPADAPPGEYRWEIGWVPESDRRLGVLDSSGREVDDKFVLGRVEVVSAPPAGKIQGTMGVVQRSDQP